MTPDQKEQIRKEFEEWMETQPVRFSERDMAWAAWQEARARAEHEGGKPSANLDAIRDAIEERDAAIEKCELLAKEMVYRGNSVSYIYDKNENRGRVISDACGALTNAGIAVGTIGLVEGIKQLAALSAQPASAAVPEWLVEMCMATESVTPTTDIRATVEALINWHVSVDRSAAQEHRQ